MEATPGRSGEAEDDQVPGSVVKTEVCSPEQSLTVSIKEEVMTTNIQAFRHSRMADDTLQQLNVQSSIKHEIMDNGGAARGDTSYPMALYKVDMPLSTNTRSLTYSTKPDKTMNYTGHTESLKTVDTDWVDYSDNKRKVSLPDEKPYRCTVCSYSCVVQRNLRRHMKTHAVEKPYKCSLCSYSCLQKGNLKNHRMIHTGEKPYKCSLCPYSAALQTNLQRHLKTNHTDEKPYKCTMCPYSTAHQSCLREHVTNHTGEKPYKCTVCPYSCTRKRVLNIHQWIHSGEKPYKCTMCPCSFSTKAALVMHVKAHTEEMPCKCLHCSFSCGNESALKRHVKAHADDKQVAF